MARPLHRPIESTCVDPFDPRAFIPMLPRRARTPEDVPDDWVIERRWGGMRIIAGLGADVLCLAGRGGRDFAPLFPELAALVDQVRASDWIIDGEIVGIDEAGRPDHTAVVARVRDARAGTAELHPTRIRYVAYDMLAVDRQDLRDASWRERRDTLERSVDPVGPLLLTEPEASPPQLAITRARELGHDGIVAKNPDSTYRSGMRPHDTWLELLTRRHAHFLVVGSTPLSVGGREDPSRVGALQLAARLPDGTLRDAGRVGSGLDDATRRALADRLAGTNTPPVVEIEFASWTSGDRLRHPAFVALRDDLHPDHIVTELD